MINCIQQIGLGVSDKDRGFHWIRKTFGMDIPIFDDEGEPTFMVRYTGDEVQRRDAILAENLQGGSGFEVWQYLSRKPLAPAFTLTLGDLGIFMAKIKAPDVEAAFGTFRGSDVNILGQISRDPQGKAHFFVRDPFGNIYQVIEDTRWFKRDGWVTGGTCGCLIGVSDMEKSKPLYTDILGFDRVLYDEKGVFDDFTLLTGGEKKIRRVLLVPSREPQGPFARLIGPGQIELVKSLDRKPKVIFKGRYWGDLGFIHLCFDVHDMRSLQKLCDEKGFPFTVSTLKEDSDEPFDMGGAKGHFSYIEDPDRTLIEFVETYKIPIMKKLCWYKNLHKRNPAKPLPDWMINLLSLGRVKD
jgi:catechol 2,3-dioxygenase-like lactoylglutathione lyase family enzyme